MPCVYFISDGEAVKIGFTGDKPQRRLAELQTGNKRKLELLGAILGDYETEKFLHEKYKKFRLEGEWFDLPKDVIDLISDLPSYTDHTLTLVVQEYYGFNHLSKSEQIKLEEEKRQLEEAEKKRQLTNVNQSFLRFYQEFLEPDDQYFVTTEQIHQVYCCFVNNPKLTPVFVNRSMKKFLKDKGFEEENLGKEKRVQLHSSAQILKKRVYLGFKFTDAVYAFSNRFRDPETELQSFKID